jgi:hypothetical protein
MVDPGNYAHGFVGIEILGAHAMRGAVSVETAMPRSSSPRGTNRGIPSNVVLTGRLPH